MMLHRRGKVGGARIAVEEVVRGPPQVLKMWLSHWVRGSSMNRLGCRSVLFVKMYVSLGDRQYPYTDVTPPTTRPTRLSYWSGNGDGGRRSLILSFSFCGLFY